MSPRAPLAVSVILALLLAGGVARADDQSDLDKVRAAYLAREFRDAESRLRAMLDPKSGTLRDVALVTQARMYLGAVELAQKRSDEASTIFERLLLDDPQFEPDPLSFPTDVIDLFIDTRAKLRDRLNAQAQERARREAERRARDEVERKREVARLAMLERLAGEEKVSEPHSRWVALVPFGVGQFQNGKKTLGWFFLATEGSILAATAVCLPIYLTDLQYRSDAHSHGDDVRAQEYIDRANAVRTVNLALVGAFALTVAVGVIEAQLGFVPEIVDVRKRAVPDVGSTRSPGSAWSATPIVAPTADGRGGMVGVTATF